MAPGGTTDAANVFTGTLDIDAKRKRRNGGAEPPKRTPAAVRFGKLPRDFKKTRHKLLSQKRAKPRP